MKIEWNEGKGVTEMIISEHEGYMMKEAIRMLSYKVKDKLALFGIAEEKNCRVIEQKCEEITKKLGYDWS